jgi:hypothetical protein
MSRCSAVVEPVSDLSGSDRVFRLQNLAPGFVARLIAPLGAPYTNRGANPSFIKEK